MFGLFNGQIVFDKYIVEWDEEGNHYKRICYNDEQKDQFMQKLSENGIEPIITALEPPSREIIDKLEGKVFETYEEAKAFIEGTLPPDPIDLLRERILDLEKKILELGGSI